MGNGIFTERELAEMTIDDARLNQGSNNLIAQLFPQAIQSELLPVEGPDHSGLGRNNSAWEKILQLSQNEALPSHL